MTELQEEIRMHPHARLVGKLFAALDAHDHKTMAACYHPSATFQDIAFDLEGRLRIHAMWHMICEGDIRVAVESTEASEYAATAKVVDVYTMSSTGNHVRNEIKSSFTFRDGLILTQVDECNPRVWAAMAFDDIRGCLAGRFRFLRQMKAKSLLKDFIEKNPQYRKGAK